ncbi:MAG: BatD family protein [Rudaea sp.]
MIPRVCPLWLIALFAIAAMSLSASASAAQVRAWLDRSSMQLGETVTLNIEVSDDSSAPQPDFSVLQQDFNLLGTQSSTAMSIINGQASSKLIWAVGLEPKRVGTFTIPALTVAGAQTQALTLTVQPGSSTSGKAGDDVFLEVTADPKAPYVQQQVRLTLKLFYALNLTDGVVEDPHGDGLIARKLGQDASYAADVDGRRYRVLERHYALSAEKSGSLTLAPVTFRGHAVNPADINSFFNRGRAIAAQAPALTFDVRARPAGSGSEAWLPAQSLTLAADGIEATTQARVGEPLTLTLHLKGQGLGFEQLPELKLPQIDGADIYPDKETTQNKDDGSWVSGERERKFAIVPNRAGPLHIPQLGISWWDTEHDRAASSEVAGITLTVTPLAASPGSAADAANADNAGAAKSAAGAPAVVVAHSAPAAIGELRLWRALAATGFALWVLTLLAGWLWRRRRVRPRADAGDDGYVMGDGAAAARKAFNGACARNDLRGASRALLAWARAQGIAVRSLGELSSRLADAGQREAIGLLDRGMYAASAGDEIGERLVAAFRRGLAPAEVAAPKASASVLPPLYPAA